VGIHEVVNKHLVKFALEEGRVAKGNELGDGTGESELLVTLFQDGGGSVKACLRLSEMGFISIVADGLPQAGDDSDNAAIVCLVCGL